MNEYLTFASAAAALLTALATLFVVWEMRRQRLSTFHPEFAAIQSVLHGWRDKYNCIHFTVDDDAPNVFDPSIRTVFIKLANVGLGTAKGICVEWDYDVLEFISIVNELDDAEAFDIVLDKEYLKISEKKSKGHSSMHNVGNQRVQEIPYILPASIQPTPMDLPLPYAYIALLEVWVLLACESLTSNDKRNSPFRHSPPAPPDLVATVNYKDIANTTRKRVFTLRVCISAFMAGQPKDDSLSECLSGTIEVTEKR